MRIKKTHLKSMVNPNPILEEHEWAGAVVFLCTETDVFFIMRSNDMPTHKGQVGFFGGHKKLGELPHEVALREFIEETSLSSDFIECLGALRPVLTSSGRPYIPIVCFYNGDSTTLLNNAMSNGEWNDVFTYPWSELCKESLWSWGVSHGLIEHPILFHTLRSPYLLSKYKKDGPYQLWGATAMMVWQLVSVIINKEK